jgi:mRNA-degrading endonuclease toxin of MazEF toxin-antitoxin module
MGRERVSSFRIRQGDIFWLDGCRPLHGDVAKRRPVIVVTPTDLVETMPDVLVVACTSSVLPSDSAAIELPSQERMPQTKTGLHRQTWAIPQWLLPVSRELLVDRVGYLSGATLRRLLLAIAKTHGGER